MVKSFNLSSLHESDFKLLTNPLAEANVNRWVEVETRLEHRKQRG
jgi:hypothetical protein